MSLLNSSLVADSFSADSCLDFAKISVELVLTAHLLTLVREVILQTNQIRNTNYKNHNTNHIYIYIYIYIVNE